MGDPTGAPRVEVNSTAQWLVFRFIRQPTNQPTINLESLKAIDISVTTATNTN